jgi:hypothetical protein
MTDFHGLNRKIHHFQIHHFQSFKSGNWAHFLKMVFTPNSWQIQGLLYPMTFAEGDICTGRCERYYPNIGKASEGS